MANILDVSIAGSMATMSGFLFVLSLVFAPHQGLLAKFLLKKKQKTIFAQHMLIVHLLDHEGKPEEEEENRRSTIYKHLRWSEEFAKKIVSKSLNEGFAIVSGDKLVLTIQGRQAANQVMAMT